jgi:hypothetical protein
VSRPALRHFEIGELTGTGRRHRAIQGAPLWTFGDIAAEGSLVYFRVGLADGGPSLLIFVEHTVVSFISVS